MAAQDGGYPKMEGVLAALHVPEEFLSKIRPYLSDWNRWIDLRVVENVVTRGETLPAQLGKERHGDKDSHLFSQACAIHWVSFHRNLAPRAQIEFMSKQNSQLQKGWANVFALIQAPQITGVWLECLRHNLHTSEMEGAFRRNASFWGELSALIPLAELSTWAMTSRQAVYNLLRLSKDDSFRESVIKLLYNDPDRYLRRIVREAVERGEFSIDVQMLEDRYKGNREQSIALWTAFQCVRIPRALANDPVNVVCDIGAADRFIREQVKKVENGSKANGGTLSICTSCLNFWMKERQDAKSREYLMHIRQMIDDLEKYT